MPEYYLANLDDEKPEEINYSLKEPKILKELLCTSPGWQRCFWRFWLP